MSGGPGASAASPLSAGSSAAHGEVDVVVDGTVVRLTTTSATSLLRAMRDAGLVQTPGACEQGECGSCSVLIDGRLECSCLVPAAICAGAQVRTVRSMVRDDLAAALVERGAVQCGFCTPGFVVAIEALLDAAERDGREVDDAMVRESLAGNLCRCTGYLGLVEATLDTAASRARARTRS